MGYSVIAKYIGDAAARMLDEEFRAAQTVSDRRVGFEDEDVDTEPYRLAIWYYTQRVCGLGHADYDYAAVNHLLSKKVKGYVKDVASRPESIRSRYAQRSATIAA